MMLRLVSLFLLASLASACGNAPEPAATSSAPAPELPAKEALIARAKALELNTPYEPVPGSALEHNTSGYAKTMCSAVFITGLDPDVAAESVGYFTGPYAERKKVGKPVVDRAKKDLKEGKSPTTAAGEFVREEIEHVRRGKHGARSPKQAIAIGLSQARRAGVPLKPPARGTVSERTRRSAERAYEKAAEEAKAKGLPPPERVFERVNGDDRAR